ncbi:MAG TPA: hypothetical protein VHS74_08390 [Solirubrobacterales bacterium]|jgi:hypothetical protein|nr:hypothetical protein [Solirubrobacterales bacterium]
MEALVNAITELLAAIFGRLGYVGRPRRRENIRDEMKLLDEIRSSSNFGAESASAQHLADHIAEEVARYSGVLRKRKIPWGTVVFCAVLGLPFSYWTYTMVRDGFVWYAIFPGVVGGFFTLAGLALLATGDDSADKQTKTDGGNVPAAPARSARSG